MKSNVLPFASGEAFNAGILTEVEKCALYNGLEKKSALRLTLLAEELVRMLPNLAEGFSGKFWLENNGTAYELHAALDCDSLDFDMREKFLAVSKSGKNAAAKGIVGKIRVAISLMMSGPDSAMAAEGFYRMEAGLCATPVFTYSWSLENYLDNIRYEAKEEDWDEYEKSVIAKLADDVVVGVVGNEVNIVVKKKF